MLTGSPKGIAAEHPHLGFSCFATPVTLPGGGRAALQIAWTGAEASRFAGPMSRAAQALGKQLSPGT